MHFKQSNNQPRGHIQGLRKLGNVFPKNIKQILKKKNFYISEILDKWKTLASSKIADISYPKKLKFIDQKKHVILVILVKRGNELTVEYNKNHIIDNINGHFGYQLINEIKLESFSIKTSKLTKNKKPISEKKSKLFTGKVNNLNNPKIRDALKKLIDIIKK